MKNTVSTQPFFELHLDIHRDDVDSIRWWLASKRFPLLSNGIRNHDHICHQYCHRRLYVSGSHRGTQKLEGAAGCLKRGDSALNSNIFWRENDANTFWSANNGKDFGSESVYGGSNTTKNLNSDVNVLRESDDILIAMDKRGGKRELQDSFLWGFWKLQH